jgi:hypothetical protein
MAALRSITQKTANARTFGDLKGEEKRVEASCCFQYLSHRWGI